MLRITPFRATDMLLLELKDAQRMEATVFGDPARALEQAGNGFTIWQHGQGDPRPVFCGGAIERHCDYATCWAAFSVHMSRVPVYVTKRARQFVRELPHARVDAVVQGDLPGGAGWAERIGLAFEARLHAYFPDGQDALVFRRKS